MGLLFGSDSRVPIVRADPPALDQIMATAQARCLRVLKDRENWYLRVEDGNGRARGMYLKKHRVRTWGTRLRVKLGLAPRPSAGRIEAENHQSLAALNIPVPRLAGYGEKLHADGTLESFLLTEELAGYQEFQVLLRQRFSPQETGGRNRDLNRIVRQVAAMARKLHAAGMTHRDLYFCHFLAKETSPGQCDIRLIDLQRVQWRRCFCRRWIVKDLAQLAYSAPRDRIGCREKIAFLRHYLGVRKFRPDDKRLIRAVLRKQRMLERKLGTAAWD
jgi:hypothetical protein